MSLRLHPSVIALACVAALLAPAPAIARVVEPPIPAPGTTAVTATELRVGLGQALGEHAYLLMEAMRAAVEDRPEFDALVEGLDANSAALQDAITDVYGASGGRAFAGLWQQHIDALLAFADAQQTSDQPAAEAAVADLDRFRTEFGAFLTAANRELSGAAEAEALQLHIDQLTAFLDDDFQATFAAERAAYAHMFDFGDDLARAIARQFPERYTGGEVAFSPRTSLRLDLGGLLGEHLILAAGAMRAGLGDRPDAQAAADSLAENSADLAAAIEGIFGAEAGTAFAELWGRHVDTYLEYIEAVRVRDEARRAAALDRLHGYHTELAAFLHGALPALPTADLESLISHHVSALINQVDAAAAGDHPRTVAVTREAYAQMFVVGAALAEAIADQFPDRFVDLKELPPTDTAAGHAEIPSHVAASPFTCRLGGR